jgi:hypothetical protein
MPPDPSLDLVPPIDPIHRRLGEIAREQTILRRLLRLSVQVHREHQRRQAERKAMPPREDQPCAAR